MERKSALILLLSFFVSLFLVSFVSADSAYWRGFVLITNDTGNNLTASAGTVVDAYVNGVWRPQNTTTGSSGSMGSGYYFIEVVGLPSDNVTFRVWGSATDNTTAESWTPGWHKGFNEGQWFNLTFTQKSSSAACNHSMACRGGYCCSGATEIRMAGPYSGTSGTCQSTACAASSSSSSGGGGGGGSDSGGGGGATPSAPPTSTTPPSSPTPDNVGTGGTPVGTVDSSPVVGNVVKGETATFELPKVEQTGVAAVEIKAASQVSGVSVSVTVVALSTSKQAPPVVQEKGAVFQYLDIKPANLANNKIDEAKVKFQVPKGWVAGQKLDPLKVSLTKLTDNKWVKQTTRFLKSDDKFYYYESDVKSFSTFAIVGEKSELTAESVNAEIRDFYSGKSSLGAFDVIKLIRRYYAGAGG